MPPPKAEEKLENEEYSSREFLRAVTYSFNVSNDKYFDEWAAEEWETLENSTDSDKLIVVIMLILNICYTPDSIQRSLSYVSLTSEFMSLGS